MDEILMKVIEFLIIATITFVIRYGIPYARNKVENEKLKMVLGWVEQSVKAAEQTLTVGEDKKEAVLIIMREILKKKNVNISEAQLETLIESAVYAMNQAKEEE